MMIDNLITGLSALLNALTFTGLRYETLSARCWRSRNHWFFGSLKDLINTIFFWQDNHCKEIYELELRMGIQ